jgi:Cu(I)/Ag(I) efflux system membrane fusion protein
VVDNAGGLLKPDMFVRGVLKSRLDAGGHIIDIELAGKWICPMHPEVVEPSRGPCKECGMDLVSAVSLGFVRDAAIPNEAPILIPASSPLITGKRAVVYVEVESDDGYVFEGREVELGPKAGEYYVVKSGIEEGEVVVTNGAFKIDSELQIRAQPSMMSESSAASPTHHGGDSKTPAGSILDLEESEAAIKSLAPVYASYMGLQTALAEDDALAARTAGGTLATETRQVEMSLFSTAGHKHWMALSQSIAENADKVANTDDIKAMRVAFYKLSNAVIKLQSQFGHSGESAMYKKYCPMARGGDGAYWLQQVEKTWNPYYGATMLHCGFTKGVLAATGRAGDQE